MTAQSNRDNASTPKRLDAFLVEERRFPSRTRAQAAIRAGLVRVNGVAATAPSAIVRPDAWVEVDGDIHDYVSRGGVKLAAGLAAFAVAPKGAVALDLGASTGGFTEVLLRAGAARVYAVDVGTGQLHAKITADARVVNLAQTAAKDLSRHLVPDLLDIIVADVSFISLKKALPPALALARGGARLVALVKPQFELGRKALGKGGIVTAPAEDITAMLQSFAPWLDASGWRLDGIIASPILGGDGNEEHLLGATRGA